MSDSVNADCPECGDNETFLVPATVDGTFAGAEFQCYDCGHSEVWDL
jgi:predicted RNA-binding Zn-ribbon protein involved in translation (DUF1610 family)